MNWNRKKLSFQPIRLFTAIWLSIGLVFIQRLPAQAQRKAQSSIIEHAFANESNIRVEFITEKIVRIQIVPKGSVFYTLQFFMAL